MEERCLGKSQRLTALPQTSMTDGHLCSIEEAPHHGLEAWKYGAERRRTDGRSPSFRLPGFVRALSRTMRCILYYEASPVRPGFIVRVDADGTRTPGRFISRRFVPSE